MSVTMVRRASILAAFALLAASTTFLVVQRQQSSRPGEVLGMRWGDNCATGSMWLGVFPDSADPTTSAYTQYQCNTISGLYTTGVDYVQWHKFGTTGYCHFRDHYYKTATRAAYWGSWAKTLC